MYLVYHLAVVPDDRRSIGTLLPYIVDVDTGTMRGTAKGFDNVVVIDVLKVPVPIEC